MSDLIKAQIRHFKHLEQKLPPEHRTALPQHHIITEDDAARYIAPMTRLLRSRSAPAAVTPFARPAARISAPPRRGKGLSIAATADPGGTQSAAKPASRAKKKTSTKRKARKP
ncbi:MAG: hypothetical protein ACRD5Z_15590, partial [Bryobacteraceae bacterium]